MPADTRTRAISTVEINHPCPMPDCTELLIGKVKIKAKRALKQNTAGHVTLDLSPEFPVDWTPSTVAHIAWHNA